MPKSRVLLIGDLAYGDFSRALASLPRDVEWSSLPSVEAALMAPSLRVDPPELIVLSQRWPGEFSSGDVDRLLRRFPLTRISGLLSSLCEGEARSGRPWPGVSRAAWHQFPVRLARDASRAAVGESASWSWPVTTIDEERLVGEPRPAPLSGLVLISAQRPELAELLVDACRARGLATLTGDHLDQVRVAGAAAGLWSGRLRDAGDATSLESFVRRLAPAPVTVVLDFPRADEADRAAALGAAATLAQPWLLADLWDLLPRPGRATQAA